MNDNTNEKFHTGIETEITSAEKNAVQEAFDSIEPAEGAKARMYANILHKASAESERAQVTASTQEPEKASSSPISIASSDAPVTRRRSTKAPLLRLTRWALPMAACLVLLVLLLQSYTRLTAISSEAARLETRIAELQAAHARLEIECAADTPSRLEIRQNGMLLGVFDLSGYNGTQLLSGMHLYTADQCELRLTVLSGCACVRRLLICPVS